jgi:hypothetical protein
MRSGDEEAFELKPVQWANGFGMAETLETRSSLPYTVCASGVRRKAGDHPIKPQFDRLSSNVGSYSDNASHLPVGLL